MTREEAVRFFDEGLRRGIPEDELKAEAQKRLSANPQPPRGASAPSVPTRTDPAEEQWKAAMLRATFGGGEYGAQMEQTQADIQEAAAGPGRFTARRAPVIAGTILGGMAGNRLAQAAPFVQGSGLLPALVRMLGIAGGEALGAGAGTVGGQVSAGDPVDLDAAKRVAAFQGAMSLGTGGAAAGLGALGGVSPDSYIEAVGRPGFAKRLPRDIDDTLARNIVGHVENMPLSQGRRDLDSIIGRAQASRKYIDGDKMLQAALGAAPNSPTREAASAAKMLTDDLAMLEDAMAVRAAGNKSAPGAKGMKLPLTPKQADEILREGMTKPVADEFNSTPGGSAYTNARMEARNLAAHEFYNKLGPDAVDAAGRANKAMTAREAVQDMLPTDKYGDVRLSTPGRVAAAGSPGNPSAAVVLRKMREYDRVNNTDFAGEMIRLGQMKDWGPAQQRTANYISTLLNLPRGSVSDTGWLRNLFRMAGRGAVRGQGMAGAAARGAASYAFSQAMEKERRQTP